MGLLTPGMVNLTAKYHIVLAHKTKRILTVTMELSIIWHIASAFNLAQRQ